MKFSINIPERGILWLLLATPFLFAQPILADPLDIKTADYCLIADFEAEAGSDGLSVTLTDLSFGESQITSWSWLFGDGGFDDNNQHTSHIYSEAGCYTVRLTVEDVLGETDFIEKEVCVEGDGQMFVEIDASPSITTPGSEIEVSANVVGGVAPYSYEWDFGGGVSNQSNTNPGPHLVTFSSPGTYFIDVKVTDAFDNEVWPNELAEITVGEVDQANYTWLPENPPWVNYSTTFSAHYDISHYWLPVVTWEFSPSLTTSPLCAEFCTVTFEEAIEYTVTMKVCNNNGNGDCETVTKKITPIEVVPKIIVWPTSPPEMGETLDLTMKLDEFSSNSCPTIKWLYVLENKDYPYLIPNSGDISGGIACYEGNAAQQWETTTEEPLNEWGCWDLRVFYDQYTAYPCSNAGSCPDDTETFSCFVEVLPPDEMEITDVELHQNGNCNTYLSVVTSGGAYAAQEITSGPCSGQDYGYKNYIWKAYDINDPSKEIEGLFAYQPSHRRCAKLDMQHDYFDQLTLGESVLFLAEVIVKDWMGNSDTYKKIIRIDPINISIDLEHTRCPGSEGYIGLSDFVTGGNGNLTFEWLGADATEDIQSPGGTTEQNPLFTFPNSPGSTRMYQLKVTDAGGCSKDFNFTVMLNPIALDLPPSIDACIGSSTQILGPGAEYIGGSGSYMVQWESVNPANFGTSLLDDPTALNTVVTGQNGGAAVLYSINVEDVYDLNGTCAQTDNIWVDGVMFDNFVADAGPDRTKASGDPVCYGEEITIGTPPNGSDFSFLWTSDHPDFEESTEPLPLLTEELNKKPGNYNYHLQVSHTPTGCFKEDDIDVEVLKQWMFQGYEPAIEFAIEGDDAPLWDETVINGVLPNSVNSNSGAELDFSYSWVENPPPSTVNPTLNVYNIPSGGTFQPNVDQYYLTLEVEDEYACKRSFKTNRAALLEKEPKLEIVMVHPNSGAVCKGEQMIFNIVMETFFNGVNPAILPKVIELDFSVNHFGNMGFFTSITSTVKLHLSDNMKGVYTGTKSITQQISANSIDHIDYSYIEVSGSLGDGVSVSGNHYFQVGYTNDIQSSAEICNDPIEAAMELSVNPDNLCNSLNIFIDNSPLSGYKWIGGDPGFVEIDGYTTTFGSGDKFLHAYIDKCMIEELAPDDEIEERFSDDNPEEQEIIDQALLSVSPNPFTNEVLISYGITEEMHGKEAILLITSISGELVKTLKEREVHSKGTYTEKFNGSYLPSGSYLVQLKVNNKVVTTALVK